MLLHFKHYLLFFFTAIVLIASSFFFFCTHSKQTPSEDNLLDWYVTQHDTLMLSLQQLDKMVAAKKPVEALQQQFAHSRFRYKYIEGIVEYYFQGLTRRINGPALPDVKTEDNQVWPPHGFQVIEQYLFGPFNDSLRSDISNEIQLLQTDLLFVKANLAETGIMRRHMQEIVQHQLIRIAALGITGFDAPLSKLSIAEAAAALQGVQSLFWVFNKSERDVKASKPYSFFAAAQVYLSRHQDFDTFNRITFLTDYLMPLSESLFSVAHTREPDSLFIKPFRGTLKDLLQGNGFNPDFYTTYATAKSTAAKVALGKQLFYEVSLSQNKKLSCATCHQPERFFTDGLVKAANFVHGGSLARNTPTLYYAALQRDLFYDNRSTTLEDQIHEVMASSAEFNSAAAQTAQNLAQSKLYAPLFAAAFGGDKWRGYEVRNALATYVRSLSPFASRFDAYMKGNRAAMNKEEIFGFNLFAGKAKCATCHFIPLFNGTVPPWFTKSESEIIGVPKKAAWQNAQVDGDEGRYKWNQLEELRFAFKTPTVRNSAKTAPYMHNGVYKNLEDVTEFYHKGGGAGIGINLPFQTLPFDSLSLNTSEKKAVVAFLRTLTDTVFIK